MILERACAEFERLLSIMKTLRSEKGCEWDKAQTHETLKPYAIEEAFELVEAIDKKDLEKMKEELGDVLLQVVFHAQIASENGTFDILDVLRTLNEKLMRRHPHVFGKSSGYSYQQWERIKSEEKGDGKSTSIGKVNHALPALSLARRIQENAAAVGFDWPDISGALEKFSEEIVELKKAIENNRYDECMEELGDLLFAIVNVARFLNVDPEFALRKATEKFVKRFELVETYAKENGLELKRLSLVQLDELWEKAKGGKLG